MTDLILVALILLLLVGYFAFKSRAVPLISRKKWIVLDGSNVMYWRDDKPQLKTVAAVLEHVQALGYTPYVIFDASAGYRVSDRYLHDDDIAAFLGMNRRQVEVVGKGEVADPIILNKARKLKAQVITNDRYRDWAGEYPEVRGKGFLVRGGYRGGRLEVRLSKAQSVE